MRTQILLIWASFLLFSSMWLSEKKKEDCQPVTRSNFFFCRAISTTHSMFLLNQNRKIIYLLPIFYLKFSQGKNSESQCSLQYLLLSSLLTRNEREMGIEVVLQLHVHIWQMLLHHVRNTATCNISQLCYDCKFSAPNSPCSLAQGHRNQSWPRAIMSLWLDH